MLSFSESPEVKRKMKDLEVAVIIELLQHIANNESIEAFNQEADKAKEMLATRKIKEAAPPTK